MSETPKTKLSAGTSAKASKKVAVSNGTPKATPEKKAPAKKAPAKKAPAKKATPSLEVVVEPAPKGFWARVKAIFLGA